MRSSLPILGVAVTLVLTLPAGTPASVTGEEFLRGMVVSCPRAGQIWGTPAMTAALRELESLGVEWVAIHPYAWIDEDGTVLGFRSGDPRYLQQAARRIESAGMELFWKPHLGYWGSFEWRGAIEFGEDEEAWDRFFRTYERFIVEQARLAERLGVPLFAVGVELDATTHRDEEWRGIVTAVRSVYTGQIVYAANWDRVHEVPFWDTVDLIGVHAYFPLVSERIPSPEALRSAWDRPLATLERLAGEHDRPVLVAEIGYNRSPRAATEPWDHETVDSPEARRLRARLIDAALRRLETAPHVVGMFWWKWMPGSPNDPGDETFSMRDPEARAVLRRYWGSNEEHPAH